MILYLFLILSYLSIGYGIGKKSLTLWIHQYANNWYEAVILYPIPTLYLGFWDNEYYKLRAPRAKYGGFHRPYVLDWLFDKSRWYLALNMLFWPLRLFINILSLITALLLIWTKYKYPRVPGTAL